MPNKGLEDALALIADSIKATYDKVCALEQRVEQVEKVAKAAQAYIREVEEIENEG